MSGSEVVLACLLGPPFWVAKGFGGLTTGQATDPQLRTDAHRPGHMFLAANRSTGQLDIQAMWPARVLDPAQYVR